MIITPDEIRLFQECPRKKAFGLKKTKIDYDIIVQSCLEQVIIQHLKYPTKDISNFFVETAFKESNVVRGKSYKESLARHLVVFLGDFFTRFNPNRYRFVYGPLQIRAKVSKSAITFHTSAVAKTTDSAATHYFYYSPFINSGDSGRDMGLLGTIHTMKLYAKKYFPSRLHEFHVLKSNKDTGALVQYPIQSSSFITPTEVKNLEMMIKMIEGNYSVPANPCPDKKCPASNQCYWGGLDERSSRS